MPTVHCDHCTVRLYHSEEGANCTLWPLYCTFIPFGRRCQLYIVTIVLYVYTIRKKVPTVHCDHCIVRLYHSEEGANCTLWPLYCTFIPFGRRCQLYIVTIVLYVYTIRKKVPTVHCDHCIVRLYHSEEGANCTLWPLYCTFIPFGRRCQLYIVTIVLYVYTIRKKVPTVH